MKSPLPIATFAAIAASMAFNPAIANDAHHDAAPASATAVASAEVAYSEGVVKKVDKSKGKITIAHGPLVNLGMPPMTMAFRAGDPAQLDLVGVGDKVRFVAEDVNGALTVTTLEAAR